LCVHCRDESVMKVCTVERIIAKCTEQTSRYAMRTRMCWCRHHRYSRMLQRYIGNMLGYLDIFSGWTVACRFMIACDRRPKLRCMQGVSADRKTYDATRGDAARLTRHLKVVRCLIMLMRNILFRSSRRSGRKVGSWGVKFTRAKRIVQERKRLKLPTVLADRKLATFDVIYR